MSQKLHHLFKAITDGHLSQVEVAIKNDQELINKTDDHGLTALIVAAQHSNNDMINALVRHGAHINWQTPQLQTALMIAAQKGNLDMVKYLVKNGADVHRVDKQGKTAIAYAYEGKKESVAAYLEQVIAGKKE